jgi:hypothetical protein
MTNGRSLIFMNLPNGFHTALASSVRLRDVRPSVAAPTDHLSFEPQAFASCCFWSLVNCALAADRGCGPGFVFHPTVPIQLKGVRRPAGAAHAC